MEGFSYIAILKLYNFSKRNRWNESNDEAFSEFHKIVENGISSIKQGFANEKSISVKIINHFISHPEVFLECQKLVQK